MTDTMTRPEHTVESPWSLGSVPPGSVPPPTEPPFDHHGGHRGGDDRRWPRRIAGGAAVLALVAGGGVAGGIAADHYLVTDAAPAASTSVPATATSTVTDGNALAAVAAKVSPSIVTVMVDSSGSSAIGSGVILEADGLVLTNNHVVESDGTVSIRLSDGRTVPATVVATDPTHDLALVQAAGISGLTPATFGTNSSVAVGDTVLAFGSPLGLTR